jgi:hypothetical protein
MKAGTTSLWRYLESHPDIFVARDKEPNFFTTNGNWHLGLDWYESLFAGVAGERAIGEASTAYSKHPKFSGAAERIAKHLPNARLIYVMRHPLERMVSHYNHMASKGMERRPIDDALLEDPHYLQVSRYAAQMEQYLRFFPREQLHLVTTESLRDDRVAAIQAVYRFLGVDHQWQDPIFEVAYHRTAAKRSPRPLIQKMRRVPAYYSVTSRIPTRLRVALYEKTSLARTRIKEAAASPKTLEELEARVRDDVVELRTYMPPDFDGWGIA